MIRSLLFAVVLLLSSAEGALAQAGPVSCTCYCGKVLRPPCSDNACKQACGWRGPGGNSSGPAPVPYDPLPDLTRNYNAALDQLIRYSDAARRARGLPQPRSIDELNAQLQSLYAGAGTDLQLLYNQAFGAGVRVGRAESAIRALPQRIAALRNEIASLNQRIRDANLRDERARARAAEFDRLGLVIDNHRQSLDQQNHVLSLDLHRYLWVVAPEGLLESGLREPPSPRGMDLELRGPPPKPLTLPLAGPAADSASEPVRPELITLPPLKGSPDERIGQVRGLEQLFQSYQNELALSRAGLEKRRPTLERLESEVRQLASEGRSRADTLYRSEADLSWARSVRDVAQRNFDARRHGFARRAVEFVLLKEFKDRMLVPGIRDFLAANGRNPGSYDLNDKVMQEYYAGRKRLLVSRGRPWAATIAFVEVQRKALSLIEANQNTIATAAELLAHGSPEQLQRYAEQVFARLDRDAIDIIKKSGPVTLPSPFNRIASYTLGLASAAQNTDE